MSHINTLDMREKLWIVQRYDGPKVGWFTISPGYKTQDEAYLFFGAIDQTPGALYAVTYGGIPCAN